MKDTIKCYRKKLKGKPRKCRETATKVLLQRAKQNFMKFDT
jgi:hypothetical protein